MIRLSKRSLDDLPGDVGRPRYDRDAVRTGVVHLGIGAFHRAHQAAVFEAALQTGDLRWGIVGVSLRSAAVRDRLAPQDGLYTLQECDATAERLRVIGAIRAVLVAPEDPAAVVAALASPDVHIVTLTVTEKGYKLDVSSGAPDRADPDMRHDLSRPEMPRTAAGFICAGLARRRADGLPPFTTLSCDNVPDNGPRLRDAVLEIARSHDAALAAWIEAQAAFPRTMVDRIVPATTDDDLKAVARRIGVEDRGTVKTERFLQWVIEDRFCGPRPDLAAIAGVELVESVAPWEQAKLRLLNGAHSGIAYLGGLHDIEFVHEVVALEAGRRFVEALWDESAPTLRAPPGLDLAAYRLQLMARFGSAALHHRTHQIAADGSQKLPQRLLAPIRDRLAGGAPVDTLALAVAAWMRWQSGRTRSGRSFAVEDPLASVTARAVSDRTDDHARVDALLAIGAIFPRDLAENQPFRDLVRRCYERLGADRPASLGPAPARHCPSTPSKASP